MKYDEIRERSGPEVKVSGPKEVFEVLRKWGGKRVESFYVLSLNGANVITRVKLISVGTANRCLVTVRDVFRLAIHEGSVSIVVGHNHPSQNLSPSPEDREITKRLVEAGKLLGIPVHDHIIFGKNDYYSMQEHGEIPFSR